MEKLARSQTVNSQRGQAALIILAVMAIGMSIAFSLSRQITTDVEISQKETESAKAFSAAEAGIEEALRQLAQGQTSVTLNPNELGVDEVEVQIQDQGNQATFLYPLEVRPGEIAIIWLRNHTPDGQLDLNNGYNRTSIKACWQSSAALEAIYFYRTASDYQIRRWAFDPNATRASSNNFSTTIGGCSEIDGLNLGVTLDLSDGTPLFLVLRPFYQSTKVGAVAETGSNLPPQGYLITSAGAVNRGETKIARKIMVFQGWPVPEDSILQAIWAADYQAN